MKLGQNTAALAETGSIYSEKHDILAVGIEWPTLGVAAVCIVLMPLITYFSDSFPLVLSLLALGIVLALQSSLQHEVLHGHPFSSEALNELLVFLPAGLFVPYRRFKDTHLQHHYDPDLTDPYDDPESNFLDPKTWDQMGPIHRLIYRMNNTMCGRMVLGPAVGLICFYKSDLHEISRGNKGVVMAYALHFMGLIPLVWWLYTFSTMPFWAYFCAAYFGMSLLKIRTFLEHQAHEKVPGRTVIIEDRGPLSFLFLNNNFHSVHHAHPKAVWYRLPQLYALRREEYLRMNQGYLFESYGDVFRRFLFKAKDPVPHPLRASTCDLDSKQDLPN